MSQKLAAQQGHMFAGGEELPLFSGTPVAVRLEVADPRTIQRQERMADCPVCFDTGEVIVQGNTPIKCICQKQSPLDRRLFAQQQIADDPQQTYAAVEREMSAAEQYAEEEELAKIYSACRDCNVPLSIANRDEYFGDLCEMCGVKAHAADQVHAEEREIEIASEDVEFNEAEVAANAKEAQKAQIEFNIRAFDRDRVSYEQKLRRAKTQRMKDKWAAKAKAADGYVADNRYRLAHLDEEFPDEGDKPCGKKGFGFMPPCVLKAGHVDACSDGFGGSYTHPDSKMQIVREARAAFPVSARWMAGVSALTLEDLLNEILGTHNEPEIVLQMLIKLGDVKGVLSQTAAALAGQSRLSLKRAQKVLAAIELGRRLLRWTPPDMHVIKSPADCAQALQDMQLLEQEQMRVLILNTKNQLIANALVYQGSLHTTVIRINELFREAIRCNAAAVVIAHNHPSGDPTPSPEDIAVTREIVKAGKLLDIEVLDHMVIGHGDKFVSLKERGLGFG